MSEDQWDDLDSESTVLSLRDAIRAGGHECEFLEADESIIDTVRAYKPDICFNIAEGHFGDSREAQIPAILEKLQIPYTGSKVLTLALALDKPMTKRILAWHNLPTPEFQSFEREDEPLEEGMHYPLFIKPSREGTAWASLTSPSCITTMNFERSCTTSLSATNSQPWWSALLKGVRSQLAW